MSNNWFNVDKTGLAAILERRGKFFALAELISNAWDSGTDLVVVALKPLPNSPYATLTVEDWGEGFADLNDSFTMFSRSRRANDPHKRGRFNLGEKLVLAVCKNAVISTTAGNIVFSEDGTKSRSAGKNPGVDCREVGTYFNANIRMTRDEYAEVCQQMKRLVPPVGTMFNGVELERPDSICRFEVKLPTEIADQDGLLRRTSRNTRVEVYKDETGTGEILEMGIPVVETDNGYRVNVLQKIPLNMERDNVIPTFLRQLQVAVLNEVAKDLTPEEAAQPWAQEAAGDARAKPEAVKTVIQKRFGDRAVIATPNDPLANAQAEAAGYTVIPGGALSGDLWGNVRKHEILLPSSKVFPTPKPEQVVQQNANKCPSCGRPM
jgi:hypothetical protein